MAAGLPPDSQAAIAWSCGEAVGAAAARARARLRALARSSRLRSRRSRFRADLVFSFTSARSSCVCVLVPAGTSFDVWFSSVAAKATAGAAAAVAHSAGTRTFLTEDLHVGCVALSPSAAVALDRSAIEAVPLHTRPAPSGGWSNGRPHWVQALFVTPRS